MTENLLMDAFFVQFGELKNGQSETHVDRRHKISTLCPMKTGVAGERQWFNKRHFTNKTPRNNTKIPIAKSHVSFIDAPDPCNA